MPPEASSRSPFAVRSASEETLDVSGVAFARQLTLEGGETLELFGSGLMRYKRVLRGFAAGLYLGPGASGPTRGAPRRLELSYFWAIPGRLFARAGEDALAKQYRRAELRPFADRLESLRAAYRDVKPGDRYALTYLPEVDAMQLALGGEELAVVSGEDFAALYLGIWLGEKPIDRGLRAQLLRA